MCIKIGQIAMVRDDYHDIERLLLLKNINSSKNCISIIVKDNITVHRQNGLLYNCPFLPYISLKNLAVEKFKPETCTFHDGSDQN